MSNFFIIKKLFIIFAIWSTYLISYLFLRETYPPISGYISLFGQVFLDAVIFLLAYHLFIKSKGQDKWFYFSISIAFLFSTVSDLAYNYIINIKSMNPTTFQDSLFDLPFIISLFFQLVSWTIVCYITIIKNIKKINWITATALFFSLALTSIIMVGFATKSWNIPYDSLIGKYQSIDTIFEALLMAILINILMLSRKSYITFMSSGSILVILSDFIIRFNVIENTILKNSLLECYWVLGLSLITFGLWLKKKSIQKLRLMKTQLTR